jgi:hypothetical protein
MKHSTYRPVLASLLGIIAVLALVVTSGAVAQKEDPNTPNRMMEAWTAAATPGEMHRHLDRYEGQWTIHVKMWMMPGAPPEESPGTMTGEWLYDGRFMRTQYTGTVMGQPFVGTGIDGYDNVREVFTYTWYDNTRTGIMNLEGHCGDDACRTVVYEGLYPDPVSGEMAHHRMVYTFTDPDSFEFEVFVKTPEGEMKTMELEANRAG